MPKPRVLVHDNLHLRSLVAQAIQAEGPHCDLNHLDVSRVTNMDTLFAKTTFTGDISTWDTSNVESMVEMFYNCPFNSDVSRWNTSKVENMISMFQQSAFNGNISQWDVRNVCRFDAMFLDGAFSGDLSCWNMLPQPSAAAIQLFRMFSTEQLPTLSKPNIYCWVCGIKVPYDVVLRPEWQTHLLHCLAPLQSLGLPALETAMLVHQAWVNPQMGLHASQSLALPNLD